jgi:ABC-type transporter Mla MlaB component
MLRKTGGEVFRFSIEGKVTSSMVGELKEAILPVISRSHEIQIDLSTISEIDFAGLLLMVDAKLTASSEARRCTHGQANRLLKFWKYRVCGASSTLRYLPEMNPPRAKTGIQ